MSMLLESVLDPERREACAKHDAEAARAESQALADIRQKVRDWHRENDRRALELQRRELDCGVMR